MVAEQNTIIPISGQLARTVQVGDTLEIELTIRNTYPIQTVMKLYRVMVVDRINQIVDCILVDERAL